MVKFKLTMSISSQKIVLKGDNVKDFSEAIYAIMGVEEESPEGVDIQALYNDVFGSISKN